ncbi:hypothetical protein HUT16_16940 [Kitasatospora sp. NA04385]|uniref:hypothetical protein n=1 Tax=Kitasatospora sp. NA04385 TaxID=2742135 RepID=UPI0015911754|nr:hypothetical protein [Kitasatospora sp. NA04385]QKW20526.1 hypothetical protein HUT16_16940 [Kitasatospora sp. NA04385]
MLAEVQAPAWVAEWFSSETRGLVFVRRRRTRTESYPTQLAKFREETEARMPTPERAADRYVFPCEFSAPSRNTVQISSTCQPSSDVQANGDFILAAERFVIVLDGATAIGLPSGWERSVS